MFTLAHQLGFVRVACALLMLLSAGVAGARVGLRPLFEPTDLELEKPGTTEIDLQFGMIRSRGPWRVVVPDFELDLGLFNNLEFDVDGAYAIEGPARGPFSFDHPAPDSLWPSLKIGIVDFVDSESAIAFPLGVQLGPKLPTAPSAHGVGVEGLLLIGLASAHTHLALNAGAFVDPAPDATSGRPVGIEVGLDLDQDLDAKGRYGVTAELSAVHFVSSDPHQLLATAGLEYSPGEWLQLSVVGLLGFLEGSDRYGALLGVSPKFALWK